MAGTEIRNTGKQQPLRWLLPLLAALVMAAAPLLTAAPASAEGTEEGTGSGWTYSGEPDAEATEAGGGLQHGGSVGSGGGTPEQSPPPESPPPAETSEPSYPVEEAEYAPGYGEAESESTPSYSQPLEVTPIEPQPPAETSAPVGGGVAPALVPPDPLNAEMIDGAAPFPQGAAHYGGAVVSSSKVLIWLAVAAVALLLLASRRRGRSTRRGVPARPVPRTTNGAAPPAAPAQVASPVLASTRTRTRA